MLALALSATIAQAASLECKAIFRELDSKGKEIEETAAMPVTFSLNGAVKYERDMAGKYYSVNTNGGGTFLMQIVAAPDYVKGSVFRGAPDREGRLNLAEVDGTRVHKIECRARD